MALADYGFILNTTDGIASGKSYVESVESGRFIAQGDSSYAERVFYVDWGFIRPFVQYLLGFPYLSGSAGGYYTLTRSAPFGSLPDIHPKWGLLMAGSGYFTSAPTGGLYCTDVSVEGWGWDKTITQDPTANYSPYFKNAKVKATYRAVDYNVLADANISSELDRFVSRMYTFNHQYATYFGPMYFVSGNQQNPTVNPGKIVGILEKTITWYNVPSRPADPYNVPTYPTVKTLLGRTNSTTFDGDVAGSVLFLGVDPKRTKPNLVQGAVYWDIAYKFGVMNNGNPVGGDGTDACAGWNYILNGYLKPAAWDLLTDDKTTTGSRIYQNGDLNLLFKVPV